MAIGTAIAIVFVAVVIIIFLLGQWKSCENSIICCIEVHSRPVIVGSLNVRRGSQTRIKFCVSNVNVLQFAPELLLLRQVRRFLDAK